MLGHEWMEEASNRLTFMMLHYHDQFESAVQSINALWRANSKCHWYDAKEFWKDGKVSLPPKILESLMIKQSYNFHIAQSHKPCY